MIQTLFLIGVLFLTFQSHAGMAIDRFEKVSEGVYRGARPGREGLEELAAAGFKTILNLDNDREAMSQEQADADRLGLKLVSNPMSGFWRPKDRQLEASLEVLSNPANHPVYIHCQHGRDRTGLTVALYRVTLQGWTAETAYREMIDKGFRRALVLLEDYYFEKTDYRPYQNSDPVSVGAR